MRILHIIAGIEIELGGPVFALKNIIKLEKELGYESDILTCGNLKNVDFGQFNTRIFLYRRSFPRRFSQSNLSINWLKQNFRNYDLFIIHGIWAVILLEAVLLLRKHNKKYVIRPAGSLDPFDVQKKKYLKIILGYLLIRKILNSSSGLFCTSDIEAEKVITYNANIKKYILPLPHQVSIRNSDSNFFRKKYNLTEKDFVFLFLSRIDYKKGLILLLNAFRKAVNNFTNIKLVIAGTGKKKYEKKIKRVINDLKLWENVIWTGFLNKEEKESCFNSCNCYILPSMNENFGNSIIEALSYKIPVIITDNVYIWRKIIDNDAGWLCKYNVDSIYEVIEDVLINKDDYIIKKENTLKAAEQFSYKSLLPTYKLFYESLL